MWQGLLVLSFLIHCITARPLRHDENLTLRDDASTVESNRQEVRRSAAVAKEVDDLLSDGSAPNKNQDSKSRMKNASGKSDEGGYYKTYGSDADGEKGYLKETYSKGDHGYKTLDTFHKRDGDKYGFEKHTSYGMARADKKGTYHEKDADHEGAGTIVDTHYVADGGDHHDRGGEYSRYIDDSDHDHYIDDDNASYVAKAPESLSYDHGESRSAGNGQDGSYESHSSYSIDSGSVDDDEKHY